MKSKPRFNIKRVSVEKVKHSAEGTKCKADTCSTGILKLSQWNRLVCDVCWYSELV